MDDPHCLYALTSVFNILQGYKPTERSMHAFNPFWVTVAF